MSKGLRLTEQWMGRALWLVAFIFASFLIGLGGKIVENLWDVEAPLSVEHFMDPQKASEVKTQGDAAEEKREAAQAALE